MLLSKTFFPLLSLFPAFSHAAVIHARDTTPIYKGVNLGGWLVAEPWITPGIFDSAIDWNIPGSTNLAKDEWTLCTTLGKAGCQALLSNHWDTFISIDDFFEIRDVGLTHVRIPVGYWAFEVREGEPYVQGQLAYLDRALGWARQTGIKVLLDLHGAPGGQNGYDNSGQMGALNWCTPENIQRTLDILEMFATRYAGAGSAFKDVVVGFFILNESNSADPRINQLMDFNTRAYNLINTISSGTVRIIMDDSNLPADEWRNHLNQITGDNLSIDTHPYGFFGRGVSEQTGASLPDAVLVQQDCAKYDGLRALEDGGRRGVIIGEFSGMLTECAQHLIGYGVAVASELEPYCVSLKQGPLENLTPEKKERLRKHLHAQMYAFSKAQGWFFWTWKTQNGTPEWELRALIRAGLFPKGPDFKPVAPFPS
ncbi:glycoside hydrolase [Ascobolus immersus RN42]|uniref:glucan 1,3-beta-glucosidase n=1 Tax=Ascobolus immersus RN42 TaxID=1160509 RepID=A0A3N4I6I8_ASCIM|nr:glycoside hydrolase [Ascobolus immersus RN42]